MIWWYGSWFFTNAFAKHMKRWKASSWCLDKMYVTICTVWWVWSVTVLVIKVLVYEYQKSCIALRRSIVLILYIHILRCLQITDIILMWHLFQNRLIVVAKVTCFCKDRLQKVPVEWCCEVLLIATNTNCEYSTKCYCLVFMISCIFCLCIIQ